MSAAPCYPTAITAAGKKFRAHCACGWISTPRVSGEAARNAIETEHGWTDSTGYTPGGGDPVDAASHGSDPRSRMTANELDPRSIGGTAGQGGSISSAAPQFPRGAADLDLDAITDAADDLLGMCSRDGYFECVGILQRSARPLVAEVRALRAEVAVLTAETRARCEQIRAALDRK